MSHLTLCQNSQCSKREKCLRFKDKPSDPQSYFSPVEEKNKGCGFFITIPKNHPAHKPAKAKEK